MSDIDWLRVKELLAEALDLEGAERDTFVQQLIANDATLGRELETLLAAHEQAEEDGFLEGPLGILAGDLADDEATGIQAPESVAPASGAPDGANAEAPQEANEATLPDTRHRPPGDKSGHSTIAYQPGSPGGPSAREAAREEMTLSASEIAPPPGPQKNSAKNSATNSATGASQRAKPATGDPTLIADDYEVLNELGVGGMGVVYRAFQHSLRRHVALKMIPTRLLRSSEQVARFYLEAESAAGLDHPGIVPVQDVGEHDGVHYYAMALVEGGSLADHVGRNKRLGFQRAAEVMEQVARAVQHAHDRAVIHRDIKPANIMLDKSGRPRLTDFGLAKIAGQDEGLTVTGQVMGTPSYMAPEQAQGKSHAVSNRTDVYSLGATLYALLSGHPPFRGETVLSTLSKVQSAAPEPLPDATPIDLRTICQKCLAKQPDQRYASAAALADDLRRYVDGYPIAARPVGPWRRAARWCRRNPLVAGMVGAIAATLVVATVVSTLFGVEARRQARAAAAALAQSEANAQKLSEAIQETFVFASEDLLAEEPGMQEARRTLLANAERYYQELLVAGQSSPAELASAAFLLGRVQATLGEADDASMSFSKAIDLQTPLVAASKSDDATDADPMTRAAAMAALAQTHNEFARLGKARWHGRQIDQPIAESRPWLDVWLDQTEACANWRSRAVAASPGDRELRRLEANAEMNLALARLERGLAEPDSFDGAAIEALLTRAQTERRALLDAAPGDGRLVVDLALGAAALADLRWLEGDRLTDDDATRAKWQAAADLREEAATRLAGLPPAARTPDTEWRLATAYQQLAEQQNELGYPKAAITAFEKMQAVIERLLRENPGVERYRIGAARALFNLSQLCFVTGDTDRSGRLFADCQDVLAEGASVRPEGDSLGLLVDFTTSMAASLAEEPDPAFGERGLGLIDRADTLLAEINTPGAEAGAEADARQELAAARKSLGEKLATKRDKF